MTTSLHNRILFAENWGGVAIGALMVWTVFLPMGRRFSVDAVLASMRARPDETPEELAAGVPPPDNRPATSLAVLGLLLQIAIIYWFNYVHKSGPTWKDGTAVYYVLHQERIITWLGLWVREHVPFALTKLLTIRDAGGRGGGAVSGADAGVLARGRGPLALVLLVGLHLSIAALVNLGIFSAAMIAFDPFLLDTAAAGGCSTGWCRRRGRARTVFYDVDCGVCFFIARVLARLDVLRRLRWLSNRDRTAVPAATSTPTCSTGRSWSSIREDPAALDAGAAPARRSCARCRSGGCGRGRCGCPGCSALANAAYDASRATGPRISTWLGLAACGVPGARGGAGAGEAGTPLRAWVRSSAAADGCASSASC